MKRDYIILGIIFVITILMMNSSYNLNKNNESYTKVIVGKDEYIINDELTLDSVLRAGLPVLIQVGSHDCLACRDVLPTIYDLRDNNEGKVIVFFVDYRKLPKLAKEFDFKVTPTLFFYDGKGNFLKKHEGVIAKEEIISIFSEAGYYFD